MIGNDTVRIQEPFTELRLIIYVDFFLLKGKTPSLLCLKVIITKGLSISVQRQTIYHGQRTQKLTLSKFSLFHKWQPKDLPYVIYTEDELRKINRVFRHQNITATKNLLRRVSVGNVGTETKESIQAISDFCKICRLNAS